MFKDVKELKDLLNELEYTDTVVLENPSYLNAIIGITDEGALCYSYEKMIKCLMEDDEFLMLVNRSSNPKKKNLVIPNSMGIIDADYYNNPENEGEMMFTFYNLSTEPVLIEKGYAIGQGIFMKYGKTADDNSEGKRTGGFGSTNK